MIGKNFKGAPFQKLMQRNNMKVLVTGGLGFVGSNLVDTLVDTHSHDVTVIDNLCSESSSRDYMRDDVTYWIDDVRNIQTRC